MDSAQSILPFPTRLNSYWPSRNSQHPQPQSSKQFINQHKPRRKTRLPSNMQPRNFSQISVQLRSIARNFLEGGWKSSKMSATMVGRQRGFWDTKRRYISDSSMRFHIPKPAFFSNRTVLYTLIYISWLRRGQGGIK